MLEKIIVFGYVGTDEENGKQFVEVDLWKDIDRDWRFCIQHARKTGAELVFKSDGERRARA